MQAALLYTEARMRGGIALPKVNRHRRMMDRHLAWQDLCGFYYAKGNLQEYAKACLQQILALKS